MKSWQLKRRKRCTIDLAKPKKKKKSIEAMRLKANKLSGLHQKIPEATQSVSGSGITGEFVESQLKRHSSKTPRSPPYL